MPSSDKRVIIATRNEGKAREFVHMFDRIGTKVQSLADYPELPEVEETGTTFRENALLKARSVARWIGLPALADDSGLCVERLNGEPGVRSARFAGEPANDARNNAKLLEMLEAQVGLAERWEARSGLTALSRASFVCSLVLYDPATDHTIRAEGECPGWIVHKLTGTHGFGYDPLFFLPEYGLTMAELEVEQKNSISHRSRALDHLMPLVMHNKS